MNIHYEVLKRLVKKTNISAIAMVVSFILTILVVLIFKLPSEIITVLVGLSIIIPYLFAFVFTLRFLYLSYSGINNKLLLKTKYPDSFFIWAIVIPFVNVVLSPMYYYDLVIKYRDRDKHHPIYQLFICINLGTCIINSMEMVIKNMNSQLAGNKYFNYVALSLFVVDSISILIFINVLLKDQEKVFEHINA